MSEIALATAANAAGTRQDLSIAALKRTLESEQAVVRLIQDAASGAQALNASGRGSAVNLLV